MPDFRAIPSIEILRQRPAVQALAARYGQPAVLDALRAEAAALRADLSSGARHLDGGDAGALIEDGAAARLADLFRPSLRPVLNATGVIVHTNLGRAPLSAAALARMASLGAYSNLEYDLEAGRRGRRDAHAERLLCRLTGAEAGVVVNNCAAATLVVLAALARGREVVVSRGELVEIGGGFRVPDVMRQSGAVLREVGTTNRTRAADYAAAIGDRTGAILRVHRSNFRVEGFVERPSLSDLVAVGRKLGVPVVEDLGSGFVLPAGEALPAALADEPTVQASVAAGVDLVCFSGDKLLGGPQAGVIVGRAALVTPVRTHPLMRALRADKLVYAALEATLEEYLGGRAAQTVPVLRMALLPLEAIDARARALADRLSEAPGWRATVVDGASTIGGGSVPGTELPTRLVRVERDGLSADALESRLRALDPPVIARIEDDRVVLDLRTVDPAQDSGLARLLSSIDV